MYHEFYLLYILIKLFLETLDIILKCKRITPEIRVKSVKNTISKLDIKNKINYLCNWWFGNERLNNKISFVGLICFQYSL